MKLEDFKPQSKLVTKTTLVDHPRFPVVDAHNHLSQPFGGGWDKKPLNYSTSKVPGQGRWYVCGLYLPDEVLRKVYSGNATHVLRRYHD